MEDGEKRALIGKLEREKASRLQQETLISKLKKEQSELRKKLARAEGHIDKMRFGANVEIKEHYILTHQTRQNVTLQQKLQAQSPTKEEGTMVGSQVETGATGVPDLAVDEEPQPSLRQTQEELSLDEATASASPSNTSMHGTADQFSGNVTPCESLTPLSPRSEVLTPLTDLPDSNQSLNGNSFTLWLADVTPPSCDLDSSDDDDGGMTLAREAVRKESATLSDVYGMFGDLDEYQRSRVGQGMEEEVEGTLDEDECMNNQVCFKCSCLLHYH